ncbi:MAG: 3-oxoacyl-ACP reductase [Mycobacteriales bacterium]
MADRIRGAVLRRLGLPAPAPLVRHHAGDPVARGPVAFGGTPVGRLREPVAAVLKDAGVEVAGVGTDRVAGLVFDATGLGVQGGADDLSALYEFGHGRIRALGPAGRVIVLGDVPELVPTTGAAVAAQAVEGFTRSLGKELRGGGTCQLVRVAPGAEASLASPLRFLLSARSAYVNGQVITVDPAEVPAVDWDRPLRGTTAAVTGAARGIGATIAAVLARDGATVVCLDLPAQAEALREVAGRIGGRAVPVDVTAADAPDTIAAQLADGVDVFVHNAGILRDRMLAGMSRADWDAVLAVNLGAVERITAALRNPDRPVLRDGGALVCVSSVSGLAGNRGQTNYATSKAGVVGLVHALARDGIRANGVAPGFIETDMTRHMPYLVREFGRRLNSLGQGGLPVDVAEAVAWLAAPATAGVNGQVLRVCGQSLLGA